MEDKVNLSTWISSLGNKRFQNRTTSMVRRREANAEDLKQAIERAQKALVAEELALPTETAKSVLPTPAPPFLNKLPKEGELYSPIQEPTKHLKKIIEDNYYSKNFEDAIAHVAAQRVPEMDRIKNLQQFYYYIDELVQWIPEIRCWDWDGEILHERTVYLRITQFYYYFNHPQLQALQSPIDPVEGKKLSPITKWLHEFALKWGEFLDTRESWKYLESFKYAPEYTWQDFEKPPEDYTTFNEFFARTFKDIDEQRPVAQPDNDRIIVFPAESTFVGQWSVSTRVDEPLPAAPSIVVKHIQWPIRELLADSEHADDFEGGILCHSFLNTFDYHRQHAPVSGKVLEAKFIPGQVYLEVNLEEKSDINDSDPVARAVIPNRVLDAGDPTGYQFIQCRGLLVLESPIGKVAVLPMGMAQVSSVIFVTPEEYGQKEIVLTEKEKDELNYEQQVEEINKKLKEELVNRYLKKGEMFSFFQFGGSDCVVVFERKANVDVTAKANVHYPIRSQYAVSNMKLDEKKEP
jgi:phosphatidylserine decarboxylase